MKISVDVHALDWRDAITKAGDLLDAGPEYTEAMIASVEDKGPYIVIAPGFALAHARPMEAVRSTSLSFVRLAEPVEFGHKHNDPVSIVVGLAATDDSSHREALAALAKVLADPAKRRTLDTGDVDAVRATLTANNTASKEPRGVINKTDGPATQATQATQATTATTTTAGASAAKSKGLILCVCGNGVGTSLFLKNTVEQVLGDWGWAPYMSVDATDTISARGRAGDSDFIMTSRAIADALGDPGVAVEIIQDFTSHAEVDAALRRRYALEDN